MKDFLDEQSSMRLQPLPQAIHTAAFLRKMAHELILQAEELESEVAKAMPAVKRAPGLSAFGKIKSKRRKV